MNQKLKEKIMKIKRSELIQLANKHIGNDSLEAQNQIMLKIATARCARLSYMTFDGEIDYEKDIKLHDQLLESNHMSPFEHCAKAMSNDELLLYRKIEPKVNDSDNLGWCNNFKGFIQYRYLVENE